MTDSTPTSIRENAISFRSPGLMRHFLVIWIMAIFAAVVYAPYVGAAFAFDDEPNILRNLYFIDLRAVIQGYAQEERDKRKENGERPEGDDKGESFTAALKGMWTAAINSPAPNRPLTNFTFAWQIWRNEYHISERYVPEQYRNASPEEQERHAVYPTVDFHRWNTVLHLFCGILVYLLLLRILQLPGAGERLNRHAWPVAFAASFLWFASPLAATPAMYIVQRAVLLATFFSLAAMVLYLEARATALDTPMRCVRAGACFLVALGSLYAGMLSKEITSLTPLGLVLIEYCLILPPQRKSADRGVTGFLFGCMDEVFALFRQAGLPLLVFCLPVLFGVIFYYGRVPAANAGTFGVSQHRTTVSKAKSRLWEDAVGKVFSDEPRGKTRISRRQRLLTETRVVAMYESLLLLPGWWRLTLDYDFPETTKLSDGMARSALPLALVICIFLAWRYSPPGYRGAGMLAAVLLAHALGLGSVWWRACPLPAIVWHLGVLGLAAWGVRRSPLLAFCVFWFYAGHLIESTIIGLELVFEHRLYLPGIAMYLLLTVVIFDTIMTWSERRRNPLPAV